MIMIVMMAPLLIILLSTSGYSVHHKVLVLIVFTIVSPYSCLFCDFIKQTADM